VVIAIIAVLSALLIPSIGGMFEKARMVQCVNNLKQLHTAAASYASSHDGHLPHPATEDYVHITPNGITRGHNTGWVDWDSNSRTLWWDADGSNGVACIRHGSLFSYLGNSGDEVVYVCPTMARLVSKKYNDDRSKATRSYGMNASLQGRIWTKKYYDIKGPSRVMMFAEQGFELQSGYKYALSDTTEKWQDPSLDNIDTSKHGYFIARRFRNIDACIDWRGKVDYNGDAGHTKYEHIGEYHKGRGHAVFCDGHVERIKSDNTRYICSGNWENGKRMGKRDPLQ